MNRMMQSARQDRFRDPGIPGLRTPAGAPIFPGRAVFLADEIMTTDTLLGRGTSVVGKSMKSTLARADIVRILTDGFLPAVPLDDEPDEQPRPQRPHLPKPERRWFQERKALMRATPVTGGSPRACGIGAFAATVWGGEVAALRCSSGQIALTLAAYGRPALNRFNASS